MELGAENKAKEERKVRRACTHMVAVWFPCETHDMIKRPEVFHVDIISLLKIIFLHINSLGLWLVGVLELVCGTFWWHFLVFAVIKKFVEILAKIFFDC
jgi:hypothetical protein